MADALVSIIIPVFNAEKYLDECIRSAAAQTYSNIEIIIVNDGSSDNSLSIAKGYESHKIKVINQSNRGASTARNNGLRNATGEYIQFLDADDILGEFKIEEQVKVLNHSQGLLALCPTVSFMEADDYHRISPFHSWIKEPSDDPVDFLIKLYGAEGHGYGGMIQPNAWLCPREVLDKAGPWNEALSLDDDGEYFCRVVLASKGTRYAPKALNYYRQYKKGNSLSAKKNLEGFKSALLSADLKATSLFSKRFDEKAKYALFRNYMELAVTTYPAFRQFSKITEEKAKQLLPHRKNDAYYEYTPIYKFISKYFGWKTSAWVAYLKLKMIAVRTNLKAKIKK